MTTCLYCQKQRLSVLHRLKQPIIFQFLSLEALSVVNDPLLVSAEHHREEGQGYLSVYVPRRNGLVLPADIFISVQVQGQILLMRGICELLLCPHTLLNSARLATNCLQEIEPKVNQPWHASPALLPLFWLMLLGCLAWVRQEGHWTWAVLCPCGHINLGSGGILQLRGKDKGRSLAILLINQFVN